MKFEKVAVPLLQRVAHPPPENAARPLALVEGVQEPEVELLQDQGLVETQQASQARQDLKRRFVDQEFGGHSGGWSLLGRAAPGKEVALGSLLPGAACLGMYNNWVHSGAARSPFFTLGRLAAW